MYSAVSVTLKLLTRRMDTIRRLRMPRSSRETMFMFFFIKPLPIPSKNTLVKVLKILLVAQVVQKTFRKAPHVPRVAILVLAAARDNALL